MPMNVPTQPQLWLQQRLWRMMIATMKITMVYRVVSSEKTDQRGVATKQEVLQEHDYKVLMKKVGRFLTFEKLKDIYLLWNGGRHGGQGRCTYYRSALITFTTITSGTNSFKGSLVLAVV
jgi:hypothetical protein